MTSLSKDYRLKENREEYFTALYKMNLENGVLPGLVYLYMPELAKRYSWDTEQRLWFAFLNGNTQNPITSMRIFRKFPEPPQNKEELQDMTDWFNSEWGNLSWDVDRRYQKKELPAATLSYCKLIHEYGTQEKLLTGTFKELWERVTTKFYSFGRLAAFSYLEYVLIMAKSEDKSYGAECDDLLFTDKSGSKSHRNGMLFLLGHDDLVWDKRADNGFDGEYSNFKKMCSYLAMSADAYLANSTISNSHLGNFTLESQLCQFKNGFFRRRYPGVYSDMAWDRINWYADRDLNDVTKVFRQIREDRLPEWLREECESPVTDRAAKASKFMDTGVPFRAEYFM